MRITREALLKLARNTVDLRTRLDRHLVCVYLTGSLLSNEPLLGGTTDIDLVFVHDSEPPVAREVERVSDEVHLDIAHFSQMVFQHPRSLRLDPWLGGYLIENPVVLYETQHWFEFTQASVAAQFNRPETILMRARPLSESARQSWLSLHMGQLEPGPLWVSTYLGILRDAANTIACLSGVPLTERRFLLEFPQRAQAIERPGLAAGLVDLYYSQPATPDSWLVWQAGWKAALTAVAGLPNCPARLKICRQGYYERAANVLWADHPEAAIWIMLQTWTLAINSAPELAAPEQWKNLCQALELDEANLKNRVGALDVYLDTVEETLDVWARQMGV